MRRLMTAILMIALIPLAPRAQQTQAEPAALVADQVFITPDRTLVAEGNVEAFQGETRLRARAIRYDQSSGALSIEGPIVTSCKVCDDGSPPLWQIRARRVIHDQQEQQLYFDEATFQIGNVPVFYLPRLRLPDPTLDRASGFLMPSLYTTSELGTGIKVPYFIKLGDSRDLTLAPYLSGNTKTLELRYRQALRNGDIALTGAVTRDDVRDGSTRAYLFGTGAFNLPKEFKLYFSIEATSDNSYLTQYGYSEKDRLTSELTVSRARRDEYIRGSLYNFESLRENEDNDTQPTLVLDGAYERRFFPAAVGGELRFSLEAHGHRRNSDLSLDGPDPDLIVDGRDVTRLNGKVDWMRRVTTRLGLVADVRGGLAFNFYDIAQDSTFPQNHSELAPDASLALRYPLSRAGAGDVTHLLEPVMQMAYIDGGRLNIPNEESTRVEFDEGNLLSLSRFPRPDRRERGLVGALGFSYARIDPRGWDTHVTLGRVLRRESDLAFSETSGLRGITSDYLLAGQIRTDSGFSLTGRTLLDTDFDTAKAEVRGDWAFGRGRLGGSYIWLGVDPAEERSQSVSEFTLDGAYRISDHWATSAEMRYDVADNRAATGAVGLTYDNECVTVGLLVRRRYSSSTSVEPSTNIGFNIGLRGFAATTGTERYTRSCRN